MTPLFQLCFTTFVELPKATESSIVTPSKKVTRADHPCIVIYGHISFVLDFLKLSRKICLIILMVYRADKK